MQPVDSGAEQVLPPVDSQAAGAGAEEVIEGFPLSVQQRHLWFLKRARGEASGSPYRACAALRIRGPVDTDLLQAALRWLVEEHEILRTVPQTLRGMSFPLQVILEESSGGVVEKDLSGLDAEARDAAVEELWAGAFPSKDAEFPGDEDAGTHRVLAKLSATEWLLFLEFSALCADRQTLGFVATALGEAYGALVSGEEAPLPAIQYADFADWQDELLASEEVKEEQGVWQRQEWPGLHDPRVPFAAPVKDGAFTPQRVELPEMDVPEAITCLACWAILLGRLCDRSKITLGVANDGRNYEELEGALGLFSKFLPLRCEWNPGRPFAKFEEGLKELVESAEARQDGFTWEGLEEDPEDNGMNPPFAALAFEAVTMEAGAEAAGVSFDLVREEACCEPFQLKLTWTDRGGRRSLELHYDASRVSALDAKRLARSFAVLLENAVRRRDSALGELEMLPAGEQHRLLVELNATTADLPGAGLLHGPAALQAARVPERIALRSEAGSLSYGELEIRAQALAGHLAELGVGEETPVGILAESSLEMILGILAVLKAGGAWIPLDPEAPPGRLATILEQTGPTVILAQAHLAAGPLASTLEAGSGRVLELEHSVPGSGAMHSAVGEDSLAYVLYTSGSTGQPKGVMVSHRAISNRVQWMQQAYPMTERDRVLFKTPYVFDASIWEIFLPLAAGAELVLARPGGHRDTAYLARKVAAERITYLQLVPSLLRVFLEEPEAAACRTLRRIFCGGEELTSDLAERSALLPKSALTNLYGPTEAAIDAASTPARGRLNRRSVPIGRPLPNLRLFLLDQHLRPVPAGIPGELAIAGVGLARGYIGRPGQTAERFVPDPYSSAVTGSGGGRFYRTGDLARHLPSGEIEYRGRIDRQVKIRGVRIEVGEIESGLRLHPEVGEAVVIPGALSGGDAYDRLIAYVVLRANAEEEPSAAELRAFLAERLVEAMIPAAYVVLREWPRTASGKLDLKALPKPEESTSVGARSTAPRGAIEELLAVVWTEVLGVEDIGAHDNFFELGGHSLSATQLVSRVRTRLGVELPVHKLFDAPTVAGLGRELEASLRGDLDDSLPPLVPAPRQSEMPLSFAQLRLWFFERLKPGTAVFNIPTAFELEGVLELRVFEAAINEVIRRHEILRTVFPDSGGRPVQVIESFRPSRLPVVDVSALPPTVQDAEHRRLLKGEQNRAFNLTTGPLFRWLLIRRSEGVQTTVFTIHHIISDAWSSGVLTREVMVLYEAFLAGLPSPLPELPLQYADFAVWQQKWLEAGGLDTQLKYWVGQLKGAPPLLELTADRPRPESFSYVGLTQPVNFSLELTESLEELARSHGVTLFMTVMASFMVLVRHRSGQDDVVVGTDVANRNRQETEGLIGFFINQLALRTSLGGDPSFVELLDRVRTTTLGAYAHQDIPFERLVDALKLPRELAYSPIFQVKFFLENTPQVSLEIPELSLAPIDFDLDIAKLDLVLALWRTPKGLTGWVNYSTDLYDRSWIIRLMRSFEGLLEAIVQRPEAPLREFDEVLNAQQEKEREMEKKQLKKFSFKKFKAAPKAVTLSQEVVEKTAMTAGQTMPLLIQPLVPDVDLAEWASAHKEELEADLLKHRAVFFRGFGIDNPDRLEAFASTLCPRLFNENGEHPRDSVSGNVYTPVSYPADQELLWHNENSFNYQWPRKIFFSCELPPEEGGETPLVDSCQMYQELDPEIRDPFVEKGIMYQRNYAEGLGLDWQTVFQVGSREEVEKLCREAHMEYDWPDGDRLRTRAIRPAVVKHPVTGEVSWFNQAQHWHVSCLDAETRDSMRKLYSDEDLPRHCYYGDGTPIPDAHMEEILATYRRLAVADRWQRGDVVMLDNVLAAHGRNPYKGPRKILVAMGEMTDFSEV